MLKISVLFARHNGRGATLPPAARFFACAAMFLIVAVITMMAVPAQAKYAAIVINAETGEVLHQSNADSRHYPASLTKVMTLYMIFEALKEGRLTPDTEITVSARAARQPPSKLGFEPGATIKVRDAIMALIVRSANDVAAAVGEHLGGTERKFSYLMNERARALGMNNTTFRNASGLPNRKQLTTARDFAKLVVAMQQNFPEYYKLFATRTFTWNGQTHENHNRLLDR